MFIWGIIVILVFDFITKQYIMEAMLPGSSIPIIKHIFYITYVQNPGAAFGILANCRFCFIIPTCLILLASIFYYKKLNQLPFLFKLGNTLLIGGAIGNLIDRLCFGYVIDFFDFCIWPVFNIADIAIVCGVTIIIYYLSIKGLPKT